MAASESRRERRASLQQEWSNKQALMKTGGGGYGSGNAISKPAQGQQPSVNPFIIPKAAGISTITQMFPSNYYVDWDLESWRAACDQAIKQGFPVNYAALASWAFECSPFIQSLFNALGDAIMAVPCFLVDKKGDKNEEWTQEICSKRWFQELRQEILFSYFWGFAGINFDPINGKIYKYPMQQIDPINRFLRQGTFNFSDGVTFLETDNLLFVQPSSNYERFLGWMQPITRIFIQENLNSRNWLQAGMRLAFPFLQVGFPSTDGEIRDGTWQINPLRLDAENYAAHVDPSKALTTPYTIGPDGKPQFALLVDSKDSNAKVNAHKIYQEFNNDTKNEIRELILGGALTADAGKFGTKGLGEVHQGKLKTVINARNEFILSVLNDENDFLRKIRKFYKNMPDDLRFDTNRTREFDKEEIQIIAKAVVDNGNRLKPSFFINYGINPEDIEESPKPLPSLTPKENNFSVEYEKPKTSIFEAIKKK